ncbi:MAG: hypothetical protein AAGD43_18020 [Pseudomonadota bacterium]
MISKLTSILQDCQPFILLVALVFGVMGAWLALADILPIIKQVWTPKGSAQSHAIVGACLAIIAGRA